MAKTSTIWFPDEVSAFDLSTEKDDKVVTVRIETIVSTVRTSTKEKARCRLYGSGGRPMSFVRHKSTTPEQIGNFYFDLSLFHSDMGRARQFLSRVRA